MFMKGVFVNKIDEDELEEELEVRRSFRFVEKSLVSFENFLLLLEILLLFG